MLCSKDCFVLHPIQSGSLELEIDLDYLESLLSTHGHPTPAMLPHTNPSFMSIMPGLSPYVGFMHILATTMVVAVGVTAMCNPVTALLRDVFNKMEARSLKIENALTQSRQKEQYLRSIVRKLLGIRSGEQTMPTTDSF
jgi:hypothetical protein